MYVIFFLKDGAHGLEAFFLNIAWKTGGDETTILFNCLCVDFANPHLEGGPFRVLSDASLRELCNRDLGASPYELCMGAVYALDPTQFGCTFDRENLQMKGKQQ